MSAQHPDQRGEDCSVCPVQAGLRVGSAQHGDFVTHTGNRAPRKIASAQYIASADQPVDSGFGD
jgi:hypothetical protein